VLSRRRAGARGTLDQDLGSSGGGEELIAAFRSMHPCPSALRTRNMSSGLILLVVLAIPYLTLNLWRLARGRSWAFTFCQAMKEWDESERIKRAAARGVRQSSALPGPPPKTQR
jgi:hypothetical protein